MIDKLLKTLQDAGETIRDQAGNISTGAKDKAYAVIEDWLKIFPRLEAYGLQVESFALGVALSPSLEVDMKGAHADFTIAKLEQMLSKPDSDTALRSVISTIKSTYELHSKINSQLREPLIVKIRIKISPEVKVFLGEPLIQ